MDFGIYEIKEKELTINLTDDNKNHVGVILVRNTLLGVRVAIVTHQTKTKITRTTNEKFHQAFKIG